MSDLWAAVFMVLISSVFRVDATSGVNEDEIQLILVKCQMASKVLLLFCCSSVQKTPKTRRSLCPCSLEKVSLTCIFIITVIICIILIVIAVWCIKKKKKPSRFEAAAPAVNTLGSSSRPRPPLWTQRIIIIIQLPVLFRASFCFKVFTVIVALPGVDDSLSPY